MSLFTPTQAIHLADDWLALRPLLSQASTADQATAVAYFQVDGKVPQVTLLTDTRAQIIAAYEAL